jgi:superfamily II DNA or RNA helicase
MIADGLLEVRLAIPTKDLDGDFHDKFGIFCDSGGDKIAFHGSPNDSQQAFRNYESIDIYCAWLDEREAERVRIHSERFDRIWNSREPNLRVFTLPEAIRDSIAELRHKTPRPYGRAGGTETAHRWRHQSEAADAFLATGRGILNMATGTGKTRTALNICKRLIGENQIDTIVVAADGTDLLAQWYYQLLEMTRTLGQNYSVIRHFGPHHEREHFLLDPGQTILLISRQALPPALRALSATQAARTILVHDEVHKLGSPGNRNGLGGLSRDIRFRLGLSATPEREYDAEGNAFVTEDIGPVVFTFGLENAIRRGILTPFTYWPIEYNLNRDDKEQIKQVWSRAAARQLAGEPMSQEEKWIALAKVYKTSRAKLPLFNTFIHQHPELLERCIIFVETKDYGYEVLEIVHGIRSDFHAYFEEEDSKTLERFARGEIECLLTCHRLSEGIDIKTLRTVILFSSARARLETIQRMGRCLRVDPDDLVKRANVVDFIRVPDEDAPDDPLNSDQERCAWLESLSQISPEE